MYRIYRKILNSDEGDFKMYGKNWYVLKEILGLISGSLPEDHCSSPSHTCSENSEFCMCFTNTSFFHKPILVVTFFLIYDVTF